jgi:hypothetical protein
MAQVPTGYWGRQRVVAGRKRALGRMSMQFVQFDQSAF